jgi:hypothetical protein
MRSTSKSTTIQTLTMRWFGALGLLAMALLWCATPIHAATPTEAAEPGAPLTITVTVTDSSVALEWAVQAHRDAIHYTLLRSEQASLADATVLDAPVLSSVSLDSPLVYYTAVDTSAQPGITYSYWLVADSGERTQRYGPYHTVTLQALYLPVVKG